VDALALASRVEVVEAFLAMEVFERAVALEQRGRSICHFEVGEPDFPAPEAAVEAARHALAVADTRYSDSRGLLELREAIAQDKERRCGSAVDPEDVFVTPGTSPAMLLAFSCLVSPGDEVIVPAPHYPCYPNFIRFCGGTPVPVPCDPGDGFAIDPERIRRMVTPRTRALVLASPANPTGAVQSQAVYDELSTLGLPIVSDEIYDGLQYDGEPGATALGRGAPTFVLDGFSKRYAMTGFRLGYLIAPPEARRRLHVLAQNFLISVSSFVQRAGIAAIESGEPTLRAMRAAYERRRGVLVDGLRDIGFDIPVLPRGAFYVLAGARRFDEDSRRLAFRLLDEAGVAATPGVDFGEYAEGSLRFCYAVADSTIRTGLERLAEALAR
jgi:aspartate/methionine/tyrosine aminotransferase